MKITAFIMPLLCTSPRALFAALVAGLPVGVWKKTCRSSSFTQEGIAKNGNAGALECEQASKNSQMHLFYKVSKSAQSQNSSHLLDSSATSLKRLSLKNTRLA